MTNAFPYILQGSNIVVVIDNKSYNVSSSHVSYSRLRDAIKAQDWDLAKDIVEPKKAILNFGQGNVAIKGETLFWKNKELKGKLADRIIEMVRDGFSVEPMIKFMDNLMLNPSKRAVDELYGFLEKHGNPITPDGKFLAYKKVRRDYTDVHSGTTLNKPAALLDGNDHVKMSFPMGKKDEITVEVVNGVTVVSMPRNEVDDDKDRTCSYGLHFCAKDYLGHFGGERVVIVKINPADVVSIPADYNDAKGRACKYEVVGEIGGKEVPTTDDLVSSPVKQVGAVQEYDKYGRPLSMTKDAIRKRAARAAERAEREELARAWPFPPSFLSK